MPIDDAFEAALHVLDDAPVTGPRPLAVAPYRLALSRRTRGNRYYEVVIPDNPPLTQISYHITVTPGGGVPIELGPYSVLVAAPRFTAQDMIGGRYGDLVDPQPTWIGHVRRDNGITHVRIDLDDIPADGPLPLRLRIGGVWFETDPASIALNPDQRVPFVDWAADTVTLSAADPERIPVIVEAYGRRVVEHDAGGPGRTRLLIAHFCIQAINDLLQVPFGGPSAPPDYVPPRTYMQVTMSDEKGVYSSRPAATTINPGGYRDGFTMHRRFGVPYHLAVNGGVLILIAHDCAVDLASMQQDVRDGWLHPAIAGYGSHRLPYYSAEANIHDMTACVEAIATYLRPASTPLVFYPDQRLYRQRAQTVDMLTTPPLRYVVLDSSTGFYDNESSVVPNANAAGCDLGPSMLWTDTTSAVGVLFIDTTLKDNALGGDPDLGKPDLGVRRRFMRLALDPRLRERSLLTYGDDFEKICNNGWFEPAPQMREKWTAFLEWVAAHPSWLHVVTADDLDLAVDSVGEIDIVESIDAALDPGGIRTKDIYGNAFHYDTWEYAWRNTPAWWIGGTLGEITDTVETALRFWPDTARNQLYDTAWLAFLMFQHENAWNMQALEQQDPNTKPIGDPEEFTLVEGLQVRNSLVWLKASLWARWALTPGASGSWVNAGPVQDAITQLPTTVGTDPSGGGPVRDPLHWDADPNPTLVLYNPEALVVVDRNGGRITHVFVIRDGIPRTVSGTFKSYQYRAASGVECDGYLLQNTVWTPNHRYIGTDIDFLSPRTVEWTYSRPVTSTDLGIEDVTRVVPDNFNAYDCTADSSSGSITCTYQPGTTPATVTESELIHALQADGAARRDGRPAVVDTDAVVWHDNTTFQKTFTLTGSTIRVSYSDVSPGHLVDNEFCVDLYAAVHDNVLLTRDIDLAGDAVTIAMPSHGAVTLRALAGCTIITPSTLATAADATHHDSITEFLSLHRVLTEAVQLQATASSFSYEIDLAADRPIVAQSGPSHPIAGTATPPAARSR